MNILKEEQIQEIREIFKELENPVEFIFFGQKLNCPYCGDTESLLRQLCSIDGRLKLRIHNFVTDTELVKKYLITDVPAIVIKSPDKDFGFVYYGVPSGYEFSTLLETIMLVSGGNSKLGKDTLEMLQHIKTPVIIKVFVTPNCPYCPKTAVMAFQFAMANDFIGACVYEASEFPHLVQRYSVMGVPKTVFNEELNVEGAIPEKSFLNNVLKAGEMSGSQIPVKLEQCTEKNVCEVTDQNFQKEVLESELPVLVDFYADWCGPCKMLASTIDQLKKEYEGKAKVFKLNTDLNPEISGKYEIRSIPCVILFCRGGVEQVLVGLRPIKDYRSAIDKLIK